jgi:uncharacterized Ntn-hydrolase superfamily protein
MVDSTFSLIGLDPSNGAIGLAVSTASAAVGKRVPHLQTGVGLVATQGKTNVFYGTMGLKLLEIGFSSREALDILTRQDDNREYRQVLISNLFGDWAVHTGERTESYHGHLITTHYVAMGNTLPGRQVLEAMAEGFEGTSGDLALRLMAGLEKGQEAGGDREGRRSAALLVVSPQQFEPWGSLVDLRVDFDPNPVIKLRELLESYLAWEEKKLKELDQSIYYFNTDKKGGD